ncbi:MAG: sugar kinase [Candidatus Omnitrophica bacterium]|nr:sugar kinase [Candidatus Omnitrophota bacterium]
MSLIALGTVAIDNIKTSDGEKRGLLGGSASHFSMSARFFTKVFLSGIIGSDFPEKYKQLFRQKKIDTTAIVVKPGKTFEWDGEYKKENYNSAITLKTELGVITEYKPKLTKEQKNIAHVFLANLDPGSQLAFLNEMNSPKLIGLDSMNLWITNNRPELLKLIRKAHIYFVNDGEARLLTDEHNLLKAAKVLKALGPKIIILKKGEHGVIVFGDNCQFAFPAYPVEHVVDPTGAGDTFAGGVMGYLSKAGRVNEKTLRQAVLYATTIASFNVEGFGLANTSALTAHQVEGRLKQLINFIDPKK